MKEIHLQQTLPQVFAGRDAIASEVWHRDLTFERGKRYLVEAASGTGKSSLCSYLYGYRNDYEGIICFDGSNIRSLKAADWTRLHRRSLSILFQELRLFSELTALENVLLKNQLTRFKSRREIDALFDALGIGDKKNPRGASPSDSSSAWPSSAACASPWTSSCWTNPSATWTRPTPPSWPPCWTRKRARRGQASS